MQDKIKTLKQEISNFQTELGHLKSELAELTRHQPPQPTSDSPSAVAQAIKSAAHQTIERQPAITGTRQAIEALTDQLREKQEALQEIEKQYVRQQAIARLEEGRVKIRSKIEQVNAIAESLSAIALELKQLNKEYIDDFKQTHPESSSIGASVLGRNDFINFFPLSLPTLFEEKGLFVLASNPFNVFAAELEEKANKEREFIFTARINAEKAKVEGERRRKNEIIQQEIDQLSGELSMKQKELKSAEETRAEWVKYKSSESDINRANHFISGLTVEVKELQTKISELNARITE